MKICVPVEESKGLESIAYNHFGSAPFFLIYNSENNEVKVKGNGDSEHEHGKCQPLKALGGEAIDVVFVGGIGAGALNKLKAQGVKVYKVGNDTLAKNIELLKEDKLTELTTGSCNHHH